MNRKWALVVLPFLMGLMACDGLTLPYSNTPAPPPSYRVVIIGDSLSVDSRDEYQAHISGVYVDAIWGRGTTHNVDGATFPNIDQAVDTWANRVQPGGSLVIQDDGGETLITEAFVRSVADRLPDDRRLVWVSPNNTTISWGDQNRENVWNGLSSQPVSEYVDLFSVQAPWLTDHTHLNAEGQLQLALMVNHVVSS